MPVVLTSALFHKSRLKVLSATSLMTLLLAACGGAPTGGQMESRKTDVPPPPVSDVNINQSASSTQQGLNASDTLTPVLPMAEGQQAAADQEGMAGAPSNPGSMEDRVARLEATVSGLRADYDRIMPAFASLNTTNERIQTLLDEIERQGGKIPQARTMAENTAQTSAKEAGDASALTPSAAAPDASQAAFSILGIRTGEHGGKSRIVVDLSGKGRPDFKTAFTEDKQFVIEIKHAAKAEKATGGTPRSALLNGWTVKEAEDGAQRIAIDLKKAGKLASTEYLPAEGKTPARLVFDVIAEK